MKNRRKKVRAWSGILCFVLAFCLMTPQMSFPASAEEGNGKAKILVEGEDYASVNFTIYDYEKDPGLSGGDFLMMKAPAGAVPPEDGFLAEYRFEAEQAGTYDLEMTCLAINGNLGSTIEVQVNDGGFKAYSEANVINHGGVDGQIYKKNFFRYTLDRVALRSGGNKITVKIAATRTTDNRYYYFLDCMCFTPVEWNIKSVKPVDAGVGVYELGDEVSFLVDYYSEASGAEQVEYRVVDFWGNEAVTGTVQAQPGNNGMVIKLPELSKGHYMVYARAIAGDTVPAAAGAPGEGILAAGNISAGDSGHKGDVTGGNAPDSHRTDGSSVSEGNNSYDVLDEVSNDDIGVQNVVSATAQDTEDAGKNTWISCQFSVVTPLSIRNKPESSPFALDAAMLMTYYKTPGFNMETALQYADALALAGVDTVRERYRWNEAVNPHNGVYEFDVFNTDTYLNRLKQHGIKVLTMYDSAPSWAKDNGEDRLVNDLAALYRFSKDSAGHYEGVVDAWEMANEPELANTMNYETADRLAAYIKAASIGYDDSGADPLVSIPGLAYTPQYYADLMLQNDVLKFVDIYNYHNHIALDQNADITYPSMIYPAHQQLLDQYDGQDKQIWLSEAGTYVDMLQGQAELTHEQQVQMARYLVVSTLLSLSQGTDKHFYFNLTYLVERDRELGIFGVNDTPYAPYSAQAALTETFGEAVYQGTLRGCPEGAYALVFTNGDNTVIGIWADQEQRIEVPSETAEASLVDIMGNGVRIAAGEEGFAVNAGVNPQYLVIRGKLAEDALIRDLRFGTGGLRKEFTRAERVILEQKYPADAAGNSKMNGYAMSDEKEAIISVEVNNLNPEKMSGMIYGKGYEGWQVTPSEQKVEVEPFGKTSLTFSVRATDKVVINAPAPIQFTGEFDGEKTSNSVSHVYLPGIEHPQADILIPGSDVPDRWDININTANNGQCIISEGSREGSVTFASSFSGGDRWTYPVLKMPEGTDFTGTKGITFHVDSRQDFGGGSVAVMRVLITEKNGSKYWTADGFFLKEGEQQIAVPWTDFSSMAGPADNNFHLDIDQIVQIELGLNSRVDEAPVYTVWDFGTYLGSTDSVYPVIENMVPETGAVLESESPSIEAIVAKGSIAENVDTIKVTVDGQEIPHAYDPAARRITARTRQLEAGIHKVNIQLFCEDGKGVLASSQIEVIKGTVQDPDRETPDTDDTPDKDHTSDMDDTADSDDTPDTKDVPDMELTEAGWEGSGTTAGNAAAGDSRKSPQTYDTSAGMPGMMAAAVIALLAGCLGIIAGRRTRKN